MLIDSNVLLHNLNFVQDAINANTDIEIPMIVIEEIGDLQHDIHSVGYLQRKANKFIESYMLDSKIKIINTIYEDVNKYFHEVNNDNLILNTARQNNLILITDDINMRIKAKALNIEQRPSKQMYDINEVLNPIEHISFTNEQLDALYTNHEIVIRNVDTKYTYALINDEIPALHIGHKFTLLEYNKVYESSLNKQIRVKNTEQLFMMHALFDNEAKLVTCIGRAGSGKTFLTLYVGIHLVEQEKFNKILLVINPNHISSKDRVGYLPGDLSDKLNPHVQAIVDNLNVMYNNKIPDNMKNLFDSSVIEVVALDFLRGRTFHDSLVVIDEQQNLDTHEIKTVLTRVSDSSKVVILGDIEQNDNSLALDSTGLFSSIYAFNNISYARHLVLHDSVRGKLSKDAQNLLN